MSSHRADNFSASFYLEDMSKKLAKDTLSKKTEREGPWITTFSGKKFYYSDPDPDEIEIFDIAVALSREGRFAGHCSRYYSVAQHCVHVSEEIEKRVNKLLELPAETMRLSILSPEDTLDKQAAKLAMYGLLHDASEAYTKDVPSPLKEMLPKYQEVELRAQKAIIRKFLEVDWDPESDTHHFMHEVDKAIMMTEVDSLVRHKESWSRVSWKKLDFEITPWEPDMACVMFMARFYELNRRIQQ